MTPEFAARTNSPSLASWLPSLGIWPVLGVLSVAVCLKIHHFLSNPAIAYFAWRVRPWEVIALYVEILVAAWLLSMWRPNVARIVAMVLFGVFVGVNARNAFTGAADCGCFGALPISPWLTLMLNLAVLAMLVAWRVEKSPISRPEWLLALVLLAAWLVLGSYSLAAGQSLKVTDLASLTSDRRVVVLELAHGRGKPFALARWIKGGEQLLQGRWRVVLYENNCRKCQLLMRQMETTASAAPSKAKVALVSMDREHNTPKFDHRGWLWTTIDQSYLW